MRHRHLAKAAGNSYPPSAYRHRASRRLYTTLFALFAEVERDLISERTREGLARARSSGRNLGRPKGSLGVSKTAIAKLTGVSRTALYSFMRTRGVGLR